MILTKTIIYPERADLTTIQNIDTDHYHDTFIVFPLSWKLHYQTWGRLHEPSRAGHCSKANRDWKKLSQSDRGAYTAIWCVYMGKLQPFLPRSRWQLAPTHTNKSCFAATDVKHYISYIFQGCDVFKSTAILTNTIYSVYSLYVWVENNWIILLWSLAIEI